MFITYLTRKSAHMTMKDLSERDLVEQFDNALEVLKALGGIPSQCSADSPVAKMWRGYEHALTVYCHWSIWCRVDTWGHRMDMRDPFAVDPQVRLTEVERKMRSKLNPYVLPPWAGDLDIYRSHRSRLLRRSPADYDTCWKEMPPSNMPVLWPIIHPDDPNEYSLYIDPAQRALLKRGKLVIPDYIHDTRELVHECP